MYGAHGVVTQPIREARESKGDLAVLWLDLANAYESIPHIFVELAVSRYHVPEKIKINSSSTIITTLV